MRLTPTPAARVRSIRESSGNLIMIQDNKQLARDNTSVYAGGVCKGQFVGNFRFSKALLDKTENIG